jgi:DNA-binding transcriptional MocR family regulator
MALLSGAGLAFLLILLDQLALRSPALITLMPLWISPKTLAEHYAISDDTRSKGMTELRDLGLITISRRPINPGDFDIQRLRNTYTLHFDAIKRPAVRRRSTQAGRPSDREPSTS